MKGSTNAKPQLFLPVIIGEQAHILARVPRSRPFVSVTQQVRQDTVSHWALQASPRLVLHQVV